VNRQLNRLAVVSIVLLAALIVATTYWQTWATAGLQDKQDNALQRVVQFSVARGLIRGAGDKTTLATNRRVKRGSETLYFRSYPQNGLAAQTVGYSTASQDHAAGNCGSTAFRYRALPSCWSQGSFCRLRLG